jgi:Tfp pilus assembly protein PilO
MNSRLKKQILIGGLAGLLVLVLIYVFLGGKRDDLAALKTSNAALTAEVNRGYALRDVYEKLKLEVSQQEKMIDELIRIMPTEDDRGDLPYRIKKLADTAGIEQVSFSLDKPNPQPYYTEYPVLFTFRAGYHTLGQFASLVSGFEKIISINDLNLKREGTNALYPVTVTCRISAFVYNPGKPAPAAAGPKPAVAAPAAKKDQGD